MNVIVNALAYIDRWNARGIPLPAETSHLKAYEYLFVAALLVAHKVRSSITDTTVYAVHGRMS